ASSQGHSAPLADADLAPAVARVRKFHERYTVGYGHASVAEHAVVRVGVENVSRFASALLETANPFLSFTEYSQRYQRPKRGAYYIPAALAGEPDLRERYVAFQERCFDVYEALLDGLLRHLLAVEPHEPGESDTARERRLEKLAFEDARYALSLATHTNLGMTGNARAIRDALVVLLSSPWQECVNLAEAIKGQVRRLVPTLLRYADPNPYRQKAAAAARDLAAEWARRKGEGAHGASLPPGEGSFVRLLDWTGRSPSARPFGWGGPARGGVPAYDSGGEGETGSREDAGNSGDESRALDVVLAAALEAGGAALPRWPLEETRAWGRRISEAMGPQDNAPDAAHRVRYSVEFLVSEANWHQLLRHCRRIDFVAEPPRLDGGIVVPPRIAD